MWSCQLNELDKQENASNMSYVIRAWNKEKSIFFLLSVIFIAFYPSNWQTYLNWECNVVSKIYFFFCLLISLVLPYQISTRFLDVYFSKSSNRIVKIYNYFNHTSSNIRSNI